jgi:SAM-dependent methyltransferase
MSGAEPPHALFDPVTWRRHRERAARCGSVDFLHEEVADRLLDRLDIVNREFAVALDLGARDGGLTRLLLARAGTRLVVAAEPAMAFLAKAPAPRIAADPELLPFRAASFDLAVSVLALHWAADLPGALIQLRHAFLAARHWSNCARHCSTPSWKKRAVSVRGYRRRSSWRMPPRSCSAPGLRCRSRTAKRSL